MIGIIGAMELEINTLKAAIENCKETKIGRFAFYQGILCGKDVVVLLSGIGKVSAAVGTTLLIEHYHPSLIINTGTAGGLGDTSVHDLILATEVRHHDVDVTAFGYEIGQQAQMPPAFKADAQWNEKLKNVASTHQYILHYGQVVSGDSFISDPKRFDEISVNFPQAKAVEMEAAAIAQTCYMLNIPFVMLRAISDKAGEGNAISYNEFVEEAGRISASIIKTFLLSC
ncbi:5'-methylthioadenosine/adenosylhomocysteine nucleosidase [Capnocytophaga sputigena]|uniref:5'-methylthioadenosine/adenosylhomocysteine nucleosidase n=1 Tax=Capnocytophaga sputigena TaxID=1019 RepID=UPI00288B2362|nr:5'-methylthioadenosine/adenosylhomocysteine nucleosidase [Capnocytophaga sputigena]